MSRRKPGADGESGADASSFRKGTRRAARGVCLLLVLAVVFVFGRSVWFEFVDFDDIGNVSENPFVNKGLSTQGMAWAFTHTQVGSWVPLTTISHMLDCQLFGLWAGGHHMTNVLLHAATCVVLLLVLRGMTGSLWRSAFVAALFALHPLRVESVAWITERKDVLSGLFFMLTLGAYVRWTRHSGGRWAGVCVLVFLALGLLCKAMLVTTPFILLLLDRWPLQRTQVPFSRLLIEKIPLFVLCAAAGVAQLLAAGDALGSVENYPFTTRAANAVVSCAAYVTQIFWPANLAAFYPYPRHGVDTLPLIAASILLILITAAAMRWRRRAPWIAVGWLWYLIMLAPVLGLIQAGEVARSDRYTYLPHIGLYLALAWTAGSWCAGHAERRVVAGTLGVMMIAVAAFIAFRQTGFWKDSETLWNRALACTTNNDTAHYNLGTARLQKGKLDEAIAHYKKTLGINPGYVDAHINLGRAFLQKGKPEEAIAWYRKALDARPRFAEAHFNLGIVYAQKGQVDDAVAEYQQALGINPGYFDARNNLGSVLLQAGNIDDAIVHYEEALRIDHGSAKAHNNLATALAQKGRLADAIVHFQKVLEIDPGHAKAQNGLAWLLATSPDSAMRDGARAVELAAHANQLTGGANPLLLRTLAAAYAETGRFSQALQAARRALDVAVAQSNEKVAGDVRSDIEFYKAGKPVRSSEQQTPDPSPTAR